MKIIYGKPLDDMDKSELINVIKDYEDDRFIYDTAATILKSIGELHDVASIKVVVSLALDVMGEDKLEAKKEKE